MSLNTVDVLLETGRQRGRAKSLPYAGSMTPAEAFTLLQQSPEAILVDVRTRAERDWVGRVAVPEQQHATVEWSSYPGGAPNPRFLEQLKEVATAQRPILFLCRSGVRSHHAATLAAASGYQNCFDILEGFEGDKDSAGHRKTVGGWCAADLPWVGA